jgi:hypothetical protein
MGLFLQGMFAKEIEEQLFLKTNPIARPLAQCRDQILYVPGEIKVMRDLPGYPNLLLVV